ncbi:hypothetical protein [Longimicrobium sp.]|uniref:hypothetical protein n=1 Tax=Longimicrobium sp. TaxID=2029185 RepID=UPI002C5C7EF5|nr:hypothetical protein [Longimicrobium sp.]HSU12801.1 hypothetical protein [Longimicrobium sp.]
MAVDLPLRFRVPAGFVAVESGAARTWWMSDEDRVAVEADDSLAPRDGFFSVTLSMNVGYDRARDLFFGGGAGDGDETTMAADFARAGAEDVSVERYDVSGIPTLFVEGRQGERRIAMCYLATLIDTNVVFIFYSHPTPFRDIDGRRWMEMKQRILSSGQVVRVTR